MTDVSAAPKNCSVARTLDIVADPWTFLVLREAWFGVRRFDHFRTNLGMPRGTLTSRLQHLVTEGLFKRVKYQEVPTRFEYKLADKGANLYSSMLVLMFWGDRWLAGPEGPPLLFRHNLCGHICHAEVICSHCRDQISIRHVSYYPGPGAGAAQTSSRRQMRRSSKPENFVKQRACSVARTMQIIGDRWTFLLLREAFFGVHRFDEVRRNLGISTNILSNRLNRLLDHDLFERRRYAINPERFEYRFTEKGRELYASMVSLMRWGDRWLAGAAGPPLIVHHDTCRHDLEPLIVCSHCHTEINMREMSYEPGPGATGDIRGPTPIHSDSVATGT
ncbi:MAG: helix-turn-helix transcriptional regulator [Gammaproteobacteria bacterium]|nr:helix-turn-helix transcriptional regulator [Gammaproteobacteria bacterium]